MLTAADLAMMQSHQVQTLGDQGRVLAYDPGALDAHGQPAPAYTPGQPIAVGYKATSKEVMDGTEVAITDGQLRLPIGTAMTNLDRFELTHRYGVALAAPLVFGVLGAPIAGPSGILANVQLITDGSDE